VRAINALDLRGNTLSDQSRVQFACARTAHGALQANRKTAGLLVLFGNLNHFQAVHELCPSIVERQPSGKKLEGAVEHMPGK
jgi:hypothetical protein